MDNEGNWSVSPAYDLTFSSGTAGEHATMVTGEGSNPKKMHLLKIASICDIKQDKALDIINQVLNAVEKWDFFAAEAGVSELQIKNISAALRAIRNTGGF